MQHLQFCLSRSASVRVHVEVRNGYGSAALATVDGNEHSTIQYAEDWVNFEIAATSALMPVAAGPRVADAFTDTTDGRGITWGLCHFTNAGKKGKQHSILARFDCDLSRDLHDEAMKKTRPWLSPEVYFGQGLNKQQRRRIEASALGQ